MFQESDFYPDWKREIKDLTKQKRRSAPRTRNRRRHFVPTCQAQELHPHSAGGDDLTLEQSNPPRLYLTELNPKSLVL